MKIKEFRGVLEKFAELDQKNGAAAKADSLRLLADNLKQFDAKTVKMFAKQYRDRATRSKSAG